MFTHRPTLPHSYQLFSCQQGRKGVEQFYPLQCRYDHVGEYANCTQCTGDYYEHVACRGVINRECVLLHHADALSASNITSRRVTLQWTVPKVPAGTAFTGADIQSVTMFLRQDGVGTGNSTGGKTSNVSFDVTPGLATEEILELTPVTAYSAVIEVIYRFTNGKTATTLSKRVAFKTKEDAPTGAPTAFSVVGVNATTMRLQWNPPTAATQNGVLVSYTLEAEPHDTRVQAPEPVVKPAQVLEFTFTGLEEHSNYTFHVSASTAVGRGPRARIDRRTFAAKPDNGAAPSITRFESTADHSLQLQWHPIDGYLQRNGDVHFYEVELTRETTSLSDGTTIPATYDENTDPTQTFKVLATACTPHPNDSTGTSSVCVYDITGVNTVDSGMQYSSRIRTAVLVSTPASDDADGVAWSSWSTTATTVTVETEPSSSPESFTAVTSGSRRFDITCKRPSLSGRNGLINGFELRWVNDATGVEWSRPMCPGRSLFNNTDVFSCAYSEANLLEADTEYRLSVAARTQKGIGPFTDVGVVRRTMYAAPTDLEVINLNSKGGRLTADSLDDQLQTRVRVRWGAVAYAKQAGYAIRYCHSAGGASSKVCSQTELIQQQSHELSGLVPYTEYTYSVMQVAITQAFAEASYGVDMERASDFALREGKDIQAKTLRTHEASPLRSVRVASVIQLVSKTSSALSFSWYVPESPQWRGQPLQYRVTCHREAIKNPFGDPNADGQDISSIVQIPDGPGLRNETLVLGTVAGLEAFVSYKVKVELRNRHHSAYSPAAPGGTTFKTEIAAPDGAPLQLKINTGNAVQAQVQWQAPRKHLRNGFVIAYRIQWWRGTELYTDYDGAKQQRKAAACTREAPCVATTASKQYTLVNLSAFTVYSVRVAARTDWLPKRATGAAVSGVASAAWGPPANTTFRTKPAAPEPPPTPFVVVNHSSGGGGPGGAVGDDKSSEPMHIMIVGFAAFVLTTCVIFAAIAYHWKKSRAETQATFFSLRMGASATTTNVAYDGPHAADGELYDEVATVLTQGKGACQPSHAVLSVLLFCGVIG